MPLTVFGELRIVGIQDIGPMGTPEGATTHYVWPFYLHALRLLMPLLLVALLLRAPNRRLRAGPVIVPALLLPLLISLGIQQSGISALVFLQDAVAILLFVLASVWLMADTLDKQSRAKAFRGAVSIAALAGVAGLFGVSSLSFGIALIPAVFLALIAVAISLGGMVVAGVACKRRFTPLRYLCWFCVFIVFSVGGIFSFFGVLLTIPSLLLSGGGMDILQLLMLFSGFLVWALVGGAGMLLLTLPYVALALWNPVYRPRFHQVFRLPGMEAAGVEIAPDTAYNDGTDSGGCEP